MWYSNRLWLRQLFGRCFSRFLACLLIKACIPFPNCSWWWRRKFPAFRSQSDLLCFVMHSFFVFFMSVIIAFVCSSADFLDEPWSFDDPSSKPDLWSFNDPSSSDDSSSIPELWSFDDSSSSNNPKSMPESDLSENKLTSSMYMPYDDGDLFMDTSLLAGNEPSNEDDLFELDDFPTKDDGTMFGVSTSSDVSLDLGTECGDSFQRGGKRRAKRGGVCKNAPLTGTGSEPDGTRPPPPSPGNGPSFFPGYREYILDKKTNILRIPGFAPSFFGENDVCLIYTEGYLPYGVCGTETFKSVESFWGIDTFTITKAVLGILSFFSSARRCILTIWSTPLTGFDESAFWTFLLRLPGKRLLLPRLVCTRCYGGSSRCVSAVPGTLPQIPSEYYISKLVTLCVAIFIGTYDYREQLKNLAL